MGPTGIMGTYKNFYYKSEVEISDFESSGLLNANFKISLSLFGPDSSWASGLSKFLSGSHFRRCSTFLLPMVRSVVGLYKYGVVDLHTTGLVSTGTRIWGDLFYFLYLTGIFDLKPSEVYPRCLVLLLCTGGPPHFCLGWRRAQWSSTPTLNETSRYSLSFPH